MHCKHKGGLLFRVERHNVVIVYVSEFFARLSTRFTQNNGHRNTTILADLQRLLPGALTAALALEEDQRQYLLSQYTPLPIRYLLRLAGGHVFLRLLGW